MSGLISISNFRIVGSEYISENYKLGSNISNSPSILLRKARDLKTGEKKALKVVSKYLVARTNTETNLISEVSSLLSSDHPNICRIFDYFQDEVNYYIVTERFLEGDLLARLISTQDHSEATCKTYLQQIFSVLTFLESKKIIHRNIKPENFMFFASHIKLISFKLSKVLAPGEKVNENVGTPYYMAPEVISGGYDTKADMWSAGVLMYFILSGTFPFTGHSSGMILKAISAGVYNFNSNLWNRISDSAKDLIRKILVTNPNERISPAQALEHQWFQDLHQDLPSPEIAKPLIANLINFKSKEHFKKAVLRYAGSFLVSNAEKDELVSFFTAFDTNKNGSLSKSELIQGFIRIYGNRVKNPEAQAEKILAEVDFDHSGEINYTEFVVAAMNRQKLTERIKLQEIFQKLDGDHNGHIDPRELREAFSRTLIDDKSSTIEDMIRECDTNHDGSIDLAEFTALMLRI